MSNADTLTTGSSLLTYKLVSKLSDGLTGAVWRADEPDKDRRVTIKILGGAVKFDKVAVATRVKDLQFAAHSGLAQIHEVTQSGGLALVVREFIEGEPLSRMIDGKPVDRTKFFHIGVQIASALAFLHSKKKTHGNLRSDNVIVNPRSGRLKLTGLGLVKTPNANLPPGPQRFGHLAVREVAYMSPEQLAEKEIGPGSDVFSLGAVLYEMATGQSPFPGTTSIEVIGRILRDQPPNPLTLNPSANNAMISIIGKCLHKDPAKRYPSAEKVLEDMRREAGMAGITDLEATGVKGSSALPGARRATVLAVDLGSHAALVQDNPEKAARVASLLQQIASEAVYLFDGKIADQFATTILGEFASVNGAIEAAKKARIDFEEHNQQEATGGDKLDPRMLIHTGDVGDKDGDLAGPAVDLARGGLAMLAPMQIAISEEALAEGKLKIDPRPALVFSGMKFFEQKVEIPKAQPPAPKPAVEEIAPPADEKEKKKPWLVPVIAGGALVAIGAVAAVLILGKKEPPPAPVVAKAPAPPPKPAGPKKVALDLLVESADPALAARATALRLSMIELLKLTGDLEIVDAAAGAESHVGARIRDGAAGPELVPTFGAPPTAAEGTPLAMSDVGLAATSAITWLASQIHPPSPKTLTVAPAAVTHYVDALDAAQQPDGAGRPKAIESIKASIAADPAFLPAHLLGLELFEASNDREAAIASASQIVELDPRRVDVAKKLVEWQLERGNPAGAIDATAVVLSNNPSDEESLALVCRYALGANDAALFNRLLPKLKKLGRDEMHAADLLFATGKIEQASAKYYEIVGGEPENAALALKTGRISVLRRALSLAELELKKLETLDPAFGYHLLKAYVAAEGRDRNVAEAELKIAAAAAPPGAAIYTHAAEVYAVMGDPKMLMENLQKAIAAGEPTQTYILSTPLFKFLEDEDDGAFRDLKAIVEQQRRAVSESLSRLAI